VIPPYIPEPAQDNVDNHGGLPENNAGNRPEIPETAGGNEPGEPENVEEAMPEMPETVNEHESHDPENAVENMPEMPETVGENEPGAPVRAAENPPVVAEHNLPERPVPVMKTSVRNVQSSYGQQYAPGGGSQQQIATLKREIPEKTLPPLLNIKMDANPNQGENIIATSKIKVQEKRPEKDQGPVGNPPTSRIKDARTFTDPSTLDLNKIKKSSRIAFLTGSTISFTGGPKISPGDRILIGENSYEVRLRPKDKINLYGMIGSVIVAIVVTLYFLGAFNSAPYGNLVGTVMGPGNYPQSNIEVRLKESGDRVKTDAAGFFVFNNIPTGIYTIEFLEQGEVIGEERITVLSGETSTLRFGESNRIGMNMPEERIRGKPEQLVAKAETEPESQSSKKKDPGILKLSLKPDGVTAYLDGKPLGAGSNSYKLPPGNYQLSAKKNGYQTQSKKIKITSGEAQSYTFTLKKDSQPKAKMDSELAYDNEVAGNYREAQEYYDKTLSKNSRDITAMLGKARCLRALGFAKDAVNYYTQAARTAVDANDKDGEYEALTGLIEMKPNNFANYGNRGDLLYSQGKFARASEDYQKVISLDKRNLKAYYNLGNCCYSTGRYLDALEAFQAAEELHFADPRAQACLAKTYRALNDKKNTKKAYEKFKELASYGTAMEYKEDPEWKKVLDYLGMKN
jgi:tetratricopeptide (TPR) repeat protein